MSQFPIRLDVTTLFYEAERAANNFTLQALNDAYCGYNCSYYAGPSSAGPGSAGHVGCAIGVSLDADTAQEFDKLDISSIGQLIEEGFIELVGPENIPRDMLRTAAVELQDMHDNMTNGGDAYGDLTEEERRDQFLNNLREIRQHWLG